MSTAQQDTLQGIFLTKIPGRNYAASADYVVQAQLQPNDNSTSAFGIYFRNQPNNQLGAYAFVIRPNGSWSVNVYDNNSGALTRLATGSLGLEEGHNPTRKERPAGITIYPPSILV